MNAKLLGFFSGFPARHFTDSIAEVLKEELTVRESLVFISTWPDNFAQNDEDSDGMHNMFAERNMPFAKHSVIDNRAEANEAVKLVREASCIFLMGGNATLQFDLIRRMGILDEIRQSSAVILGVSAGSMNMGKHVVDIYESLTPYEGLGFADLTIKAHYPLEEDLLQSVKQVSMELPVCLMTDESAIFIKKDRVRQIGQIYRMDKGEISPLTQAQLEQIRQGSMNTINQKIIDAVIAKAEKVCPDSLVLIGIYGSVATGDSYEKSDLDLLILIQDDKGWQLETGFILDDSKIGYDIYCTSWDGLKYDAECHHAQFSKLMDSKIVYVKNEEAYAELCKLREQAKQFLESEERFERVSDLLDRAKISYANACLHEELGQVRLDAYGVIYYLLDALMIYHGSYFKRGVKRTFEELAKLPEGEAFSNRMKMVAESKDVSELREILKSLFLCVEKHMRQEKQKEAPSEGLSGTYEEMYSNWRNKVEEAADTNNVFASYMNMCSLHYMLSELANDVEIGTYNIMEEYNPDCLEDNVRIYDKYLQKYEKVYQQAGISIKRFSDVDEFIAEYLG